MNQKDIDIAKQLKKRLSEVVQLVDLSVFGSRARGDADEYSDMDVFVEVESLDKGTREKVLDIAWEVGFENFLVIAPLIFSRNELENTALRSSPIVKVIAREGIRVRSLSIPASWTRSIPECCIAFLMPGRNRTTRILSWLPPRTPPST